MINEETQQMYHLLEQMVEKASGREKDEVMRLNDAYSRLESKIFHIPLDEVGRKYDNCRQSCIGAMMFENLYDQFMADAKEKLEELKKL